MKAKLPLILMLVISLALRCGPEKSKTQGSRKSLGQVDPQLAEASGLAASVANPDFLWCISDSGNPPKVFLIDQHAKIRMVCTLANAVNRDWEDVAIGAGPDASKTYVYVADIGDNWSQHELKFIYRFEEPVLTDEKEITVTQYDTFTLRMPDGKTDAETILIDPLTHDFFLVSKREDSVTLYTTPFPLESGTIVLHKVMVLPFTRIVAGSISSDGSQVLLKNYETVYYWGRSPGQSVAVVLGKKPTQLPYEREQQGEAIAWSIRGDEFYTLSEGMMGDPAELFVYKFKK